MNKKIIIGAILFLLVGVILWFMIPRVMLYNAARELTETAFPEETHYEYFNQFNATYATGQPTQTISFEGLSIDIPADWTLMDNGLQSSLSYESPDKSQRVILLPPSYLTGYSLVSNQQVAELTTDLPYDVSLKRLEKGLSKLNIPMPDTAYATMKSALVLEKNNYSLFDIDKTIAYYIMGMLKSIESEYALNYIYETEDICATYHVSPSEDDSSYKIAADIFSSGNLDKAYGIVASVESEDTLYAIMNSVQINPAY